MKQSCTDFHRESLQRCLSLRVSLDGVEWGKYNLYRYNFIPYFNTR